MDRSGAVEEVARRVDGLTEYQTAHAMLRTLEDHDVQEFDWLDLTPRGEAGPIEILGFVRDQCAGYRGRQGIGVRRQDDPVTADEVRAFLDEAERRDLTIATMVATPGYTEAAEMVARGHTGGGYDGRMVVPVTLSDAEEMANGMVSPDVDDVEDAGTGVRFAPNGEYVLDVDFWEEVERIGTGELIPHAEVPRADSLDSLGAVVAAVEGGDRYRPGICDHLAAETDEEWTLRRAGYYTTAAEALGYLEGGAVERDERGRARRRWETTAAGEQYLDLRRTDPRAAREHLTERIGDLAVIREVTDRLRTGEGRHAGIERVLRERTEVSDGVARRRAETIGRWFDQWSGPVVRREGDPPTYEFEE